MPTHLTPTSQKRWVVEDDIDDVDIDVQKASVQALVAAVALTDQQLRYVLSWPVGDDDAAVLRARDYLHQVRARVTHELIVRAASDRRPGR